MREAASEGQETTISDQGLRHGLASLPVMPKQHVPKVTMAVAPGSAVRALTLAMVRRQQRRLWPVLDVAGLCHERPAARKNYHCGEEGIPPGPTPHHCQYRVLKGSHSRPQRGC